MDDYQNFVTEKRPGHIGLLTLNRLEKCNAFWIDMRREMLARVDKL